MSRTTARLFRHSYVASFISGVWAALAMSVVMAILRAAGLSNVSFEATLGEWLPGPMNAGAWLLGLCWHLIHGGLFGLLYASLFRTTGKTGAGIGAVVGLFHGLLVCWGVGFLPAIQPVHMADGLAGMGGFGNRLDALAYLHLLLAHIAYGAVFGAVYRSAKVELIHGREEDEPLLSERRVA